MKRKKCRIFFTSCKKFFYLYRSLGSFHGFCVLNEKTYLYTNAKNEYYFTSVFLQNQLNTGKGDYGMKIMVCYTGSRSSRKALELAIQHAKTFNGSICLVASMEKGTTDEQEEINKIEEVHQEATENVQKEGIECEAHLLVRGLTPNEDLVQYAKEKNVDEIVIGIRQRSKVGKMIFGSTAQYIILNAHCPVVTVK